MLVINKKSETETAKITPVFPHHFHDREAVPAEMLGATIIGIGIVEGFGMDDDLVIEYKPAGSEKSKRIVLGFDETGMWY